jgi:hypothetical protein
LKTLEKINRKGNINSRKKEKVISAQASPISPARARVRARPPLELDRRAPFVGANLSVLISLSLSLSLLCGADLSALFPSCAPALSLSRRPHLSAVPHLPPTISPPWTHPRPCVLRPRPRTRAPFEPRALLAHLPSLICTLCQILSASLSLYPRVQGAPPPPAVDCCLFCGHRRVCAPSSATVSFALLSAARDTLRCALSLSVSSGLRSPEQSSRSRCPVESLRLRRCFATPALSLKVNNPPVPLI